MADYYYIFRHLSQSFFRYDKDELKLLDVFWKNKDFRLNYKIMQSIAYLPEEDVIKGFEFLVSICELEFKPVFAYFEEFYIG